MSRRRSFFSQTSMGWQERLCLSMGNGTRPGAASAQPFHTDNLREGLRNVCPQVLLDMVCDNFCRLAMGKVPDLS